MSLVAVRSITVAIVLFFPAVTAGMKLHYFDEVFFEPRKNNIESLTAHIASENKNGHYRQ